MIILTPAFPIFFLNLVDQLFRLIFLLDLIWFWFLDPFFELDVTQVMQSGSLTSQTLIKYGFSVKRNTDNLTISKSSLLESGI
jgi:hypothetical protein